MEKSGISNSCLHLAQFTCVYDVVDKFSFEFVNYLRLQTSDQQRLHRTRNCEKHDLLCTSFLKALMAGEQCGSARHNVIDEKNKLD